MALAAVAVAGTAIQVYGQIQSANAQANAATQDADAKRMMAQEVEDRQTLNRETLRRQGVTEMGNQSSQYAAGNVDVGSGSPLMTMENTLAETNRKINNNQIEADFRSRMYLISAANEDQVSAADTNSGWWKAAGTILTGAAGIAKGLNQSPGGASPSSLGIDPSASQWGNADASQSFGMRT